MIGENVALNNREREDHLNEPNITADSYATSKSP